MGSKNFVRYQVKDVHNNYETFIPVGIVEGSNPGPTLAVIGGVHGTEYCAHEGVQRFWNSLNPDELSGKVFVILAADVTAMCSHSLYTNPIDGKNLNRVWPGNRWRCSVPGISACWRLRARCAQPASDPEIRVGA